VLALSLLTNMAAGMDTQSLSHAHTLATAKAGEAGALALLKAVLAGIRLLSKGEESCVDRRSLLPLRARGAHVRVLLRAAALGALATAALLAGCASTAGIPGRR
jgi:hypothetical protein